MSRPPENLIVGSLPNTGDRSESITEIKMHGSKSSVQLGDDWVRSGQGASSTTKSKATVSFNYLAHKTGYRVSEVLKP